MHTRGHTHCEDGEVVLCATFAEPSFLLCHSSLRGSPLCLVSPAPSIFQPYPPWRFAAMASRAVRPPPCVAAAFRAPPGHPPAAAARRPRPAASAQLLSSAVTAAPGAAPIATAADGSGPPHPPPRRRPADTDHVVARRAWRVALHRARVAYAAEAAAAAAEVASARGNEAEVAAEAKRRRDEVKACVSLSRGVMLWVGGMLAAPLWIFFFFSFCLIRRGWLWLRTVTACTTPGCSSRVRWWSGRRRGAVAPWCCCLDRERHGPQADAL